MTLQTGNGCNDGAETAATVKDFTPGAQMVEALIERMGGILAELRAAGQASDAVDDQAVNYITALFGRDLPSLAGAASHPGNCGAIGALVWGGDVIPSEDAGDFVTPAEIGLQIGRVYVEAGRDYAAEMLGIAAIAAARENARRQAESEATR